MKRLCRLGAVLLCLCLLVGLTAVPAWAAKPEPAEFLTVLFTHDTHDHFYPDADGVGGYTRLATAIKTERASSPYPTVTLDAGDFSMGSLFQTIYTTDAPELRALGAMGYDATTLGNHEFDYRQQGLADMLNAAKARQADWAESMGGQMALPAIVQANYTTPNGGDAPQALAQAFENYPVTPYTVIERDGLRVAVFGVMGVDSDECAPMSGMAYESMVEAAKRVVAEIQEKENPTFIICLSHGGTENGKGEDYELARAVDGIDLIISGHTHTTLEEPIVVNDTPIVSCGPYTQNLGGVTLIKGLQSGQKWVRDYRLIPIDRSVTPDPDMTALAGQFKVQVDEAYLSDYNMSYDGVLTSALSNFGISETGSLIGTAYMDAVQSVEGPDYDPIAFAVAPGGVIRGRVAAGGVTAAQAFDILSLGSGADGSPGYPLVSVYLTGRDLKNVFEVDASISGLMEAATIYGAGATWTYNPHRMFLDRVTRCALADGSAIEDGRLYRVVADLYSGQMLGAVKGKSMGLLSITPRDERGEEVAEFEGRVLKDGGGKELKAWYALAAHLDGRERVSPPAPHKTVVPGWNPLGLLWPMGLPTALVCALALLILLLAVLVIRKVLRRLNSRRAYRPYRGRR